MEDDLEKRIADLEGRHFKPDDEPDGFDEPDLRRIVLRWIREHWIRIAIVVLTLFGYSLHKLGVIFPALDQPAPDWVGPLVLALPFTAIAIYFVVRFIKSRR